MTAMTAADEELLDTLAAQETLADTLNACGFDVRTLASPTRCHLKITSVRSTVADLTVAATRTADWHYHRFDGNPPDPDRLNAIVLAILLGDSAPCDPLETGRLAHMTLLGNISATAIEHGLSASVDLLDPASTIFDLFDQVTITNPGQPHRGTVCVTDDIALWWRCHVRDQPAAGLELADIATTIARALTNADIIRPEPQH